MTEYGQFQTWRWSEGQNTASLVALIAAGGINVEPLRQALGGYFGIVGVVVGAVFALIGVPMLVLGIFIARFGAGHYPTWMALILLPVGAGFLFVGYGAVRLGWDAMKANPEKQE
jgi:hypothetical protein